MALDLPRGRPPDSSTDRAPQRSRSRCRGNRVWLDVGDCCHWVAAARRGVGPAGRGGRAACCTVTGGRSAPGRRRRGRICSRLRLVRSTLNLLAKVHDRFEGGHRRGLIGDRRPPIPVLTEATFGHMAGPGTITSTGSGHVRLNDRDALPTPNKGQVLARAGETGRSWWESTHPPATARSRTRLRARSASVSSASSDARSRHSLFARMSRPVEPCGRGRA